MALTKEQAVKEHRKMWNWLADKTLERRKKVTKENYFREEYRNKIRICNYCWCCEYDNHHNKIDDCNECPIEWDGTDKTKCMASSSSYNQWCKTSNDDYEIAAELARKIANLPERIGGDQNE